MPWIRRRNPRYDDPYYYPPQRPYRSSGNSCLRDACLLETGCCLGEALDQNCLMLTVLMLPRLAAVAVSEARARTAGPGAGRVRRLMVGAIRGYQREISPRLNVECRFTPSCSEYAAQAITSRGAVRGGWLAAGRLLRCRPGGARGADPVPACG